MPGFYIAGKVSRLTIVTFWLSSQILPSELTAILK